ncbi:class I SAM-dependent methyltransferase [Candidatus Pacearchaeota archaeon]|nr:class I SAM-dependent methyltransferase [Candidatus Pacearchaeota archaeon]
MDPLVHGKSQIIDYQDILARGNRRMTEHDLKLLVGTCEAVHAETVVEIGSKDGCSTLALGSWLGPRGGRLFCVEPVPTGRWQQNVREYGIEGCIIAIRAFSPWIPPDQVPCPIDVLLIDGDHRTSRAVADYIFWGRFVRKGGRIAFHDIDGGKGVAADIRKAVEICERDDNLSSPQGPDWLIKEVARTPPAHDRGLIVFEKGSPAWPLTEGGVA